MMHAIWRNEWPARHLLLPADGGRAAKIYAEEGKVIILTNLVNFQQRRRQKKNLAVNVCEEWFSFCRKRVGVNIAR